MSDLIAFLVEFYFVGVALGAIAVLFRGGR